MRVFKLPLVLLSLLVAPSLVACGDDDDEGLTAAQRHGVGAACGEDSDCYVGEQKLKCLLFKGGYCGLGGCADDADCPIGSGCVEHDDGMNYCFLLCADKVECNYTRPADIESNCSSNIRFVGEAKGKACVPPS